MSVLWERPNSRTDINQVQDRLSKMRGQINSIKDGINSMADGESRANQELQMSKC